MVNICPNCLILFSNSKMDCPICGVQIESKEELNEMLEEGKHYAVQQTGSCNYRCIKVIIVKINVYGILCQYYLDEMAHPEKDLIQFNYFQIERITPLGY